MSAQEPRLKPRWVSLDDAAGYLGVSVPTLRRAIRRGDLKARRMGRRLIRVDANELDGLLRVIPSSALDE
jgi:excisionase family DNA binding protein